VSTQRASNVSADSQVLKVKISGDDSKVSRISNFIVLSFSIVQNETHLTSLDQNVFCIINCKENYEQLNAACKPVLSGSILTRGSSFTLKA
jgi:hypothetical protein